MTDTNPSSILSHYLESPLYSFAPLDIHKTPVYLSTYKANILLLVNVASQ
jgi:glutathione peroxidase-family protein